MASRQEILPGEVLNEKKKSKILKLGQNVVYV